MSGIIVGIDGSGHSQKALEWAAHEAAVRQAPLTVLVVRQAIAGWTGAPVVYPLTGGPTLDDVRQQAQIETDKVLEAIADQRPAEVTVRAVDGFPADELLRAAEGAEMIVVGSRGTGGFARLLMGSVSTQVTHHAKCPAVVIPADDRQ
ncbi:MAG TPA: universal stress protein [Trebonia sp.]|nr:universal stress protein [Trebonia sp.]